MPKFMLFSRLVLVSVVLALIIVLVPGPNAAPAANASSTFQTSSEPLFIWRVTVTQSADVRRLMAGGWDVLEARGADHLLVLGERRVEAELQSQGFEVKLDHALDPAVATSPFTYFGGYRTVVEHYQHLDTIAANFPGLARVTNYGNSWRKTQAANQGFALKVICLTKLRAGDCGLAPTTDKPRFLLMAAIHARELTTAELAWRWIDHLVTNYNLDPDITALLDYNEIWIIPIVNPDGRSIVEQGGNNPYLQRKNANNSLGNCSVPPTSSNHHGIDLNRNADFEYGGLGTSTSPCNATYRGTGPASEPEEYALENLMRQLFRDQRGPNLLDSAPITTTGAMVTLHSSSNLVLLPWGWTECNMAACPSDLQAPNDAGLRSLAFRMSYYNGYNTGQPSELLYAASGGTDDWAYGALGIPGFTFEVGPTSGTCGGFTPNYSCQDSTFWPLNREAFLYAAKAARQPYATSFGPNTVAPTVSRSRVGYGTPITLTATINDGLYGNNGVRRPAVQAISQAEYYLDLPPWAGGTPIAMTAQDGTFNSSSEVVRAQLGTQLALGRHTLFVRGRDAANNWGPTTAQWFYVDGIDLGVHLRAAPDPVTAGAALTYTVSLSNTGNITATNVVVADPLPAGVSLIVASPSQGGCSGTTTISCALGSLPAGSSASITIRVSVDPAANGQIANTVSVSAEQVDIAAINNSATVVSTVDGVAPTPLPSATPSATPTALPTFTPTATAEPSATSTTEPSASPTELISPTAQASSTPTEQGASTPTATTAAVTPTTTPTSEPSSTATPEPSSPTALPSPTATSPSERVYLPIMIR